MDPELPPPPGPRGPGHHRQIALGLSAVLILGALGLWRAPSLATWTADTSSLRSAPSPATATDFTVTDTSTTRPRLREPRAPLSVDERGYAATLALTALPDSARNAHGDPGGEVLLVDLPTSAHTEAGPARRLVDAVLYDYTTNATHQVTLDLTGAKIIATRSATGVQLPPTPAETRLALATALAASPRPHFVDEYEALTGGPLLAAEQVKALALTWDSTSLATGADTVGECATHRCVRLQLEVPSDRYLTTDDFVVDLSSRSVLPTPAGHDHERDH